MDEPMKADAPWIIYEKLPLSPPRERQNLQLSTNKTMVHFKSLCSRHIHKEIKVQDMKRKDRMLCKMDHIFIRRHTYKCNTFRDGDFEAF